MEKNIKIVLKDSQINDRILINLEEDFDNLEILSLKISSTDIYSKTSSDFGAIVGRVQTSNGYGLQNAKVSIFVPITVEDKERPEITELYPFETVNDQFPNGVRYNLLPRVRNQNPSHRAVGNLPVINDLTHYPQYLEIMDKYYKYTVITNDSGDYMIFGVPVGSHNIIMDFDLFDTKSMEVTANDIVENSSEYRNIKSVAEATNTPDNNDPNKVPNFIYRGSDTFDVEVKTNLNDMPNIFNEIKQVNVSPFWGDDEEHDVGITRSDFKIEYNYIPTAVFFGWLGSPSSAFGTRPDYTWGAGQTALEVPGFDKNLNRETGEIWSLTDPIIVIYRLDDKLTPGSRVRLGAFKAESGTGVFRISLPMYMDYFKINQFGDLVPTEDKENSIPTKGYYAFEMYESSEGYQTRVPWGGWHTTSTPGIRVPSSVNGDVLTGGWESTNTGLFEYDIINRKRKFYTLKSKYNPHSSDFMNVSGTVLNYFPQENPDKDVAWNFPVNREDVSKITTNIEIIGSALIPRYEFDLEYNTLNYNNLADIDYNPNVRYPKDMINLINIPKDISYGDVVKHYEYHKGIGVNLNGRNGGEVYAEIFGPSQFFNIQTGDSNYGENNTYNYGDNGPINPTLFAIELAKNPDSTDYNGIHKRFTQAYDKKYTLGPFLSSHNYQNKFPVIEFSIEDITDDLSGLIGNKIYTSYGVYTGSVEPTEFDPEISNRYRGKFYYFGLWDRSNALKSIEKNYFTEHE
jgi:hypothetical protein